jgi:hypothetical protein
MWGYYVRVQLLQVCIWSSARGRNGPTRVRVIQKACRECKGSLCVTYHSTFLITVTERHCRPPQLYLFFHLISNSFVFTTSIMIGEMVSQWQSRLTPLIIDIRGQSEWNEASDGANKRNGTMVQAACDHMYSWLIILATNFNVMHK